MKRGLDLLFSLAGLFLLSPLLVLLSLWIKVDSPGPVLYLQERIGRGFRPFLLWKFRTMVVDPGRARDAVHYKPEALVTGAGRFLRASKLDELPQLWNVFRGDMSLVGPRPEVRKYVERFKDDYAAILAVRPGLTDPATLKYRDEGRLLSESPRPEETYIREILPDKIRLSKRYAESRTLAGDLGLVLRTLAALLPGRRA